MIQLILIAWEQIFRLVTARWHMAVVVGGTVLLCLQLGYPGGIARFIIETFAFNPRTGYGRLEILEYGGASVLKHPVFGIGLSDWERPWWRPSSVDNFWLLTAMRYGVPALVFMWIGIAIHMVQLLARRGLTDEAANYRKGYVLSTVHIWGAVSVFVMFYLGAGAWIYASPVEAAAPPGRAASSHRSRPTRQRTGIEA
jgi:hypothetical protein